MELRNYQIKAKQEIHAAWNNGARNVMVQMSTGAGKTVLFSDILAEEKKRSIAIAHRMELVSQISLTLARYGIPHNVIAQPATVRNIVAIHMGELGRSFFNPNAKCTVAGVDTLLRAKEPWFKQVELVVQDEGHHVLRDNKWGCAAELFPNARGLYPTATPIRADGCGLGRHADGIADTLIVGPSMRELITMGYLTEYRIAGPPRHIDLSQVPVTPSGDYSQKKLQATMQKAKITGDIVGHYLKFAKGKLGVTFTVSVEIATEVAAAFRAAGVPAEVISGKTPDLLRINIMRKFRNREILQLVNVDLLGEGVDVPAIEVISMARPTCSYAVYAQQFGRALRPMEGKKYALILDHVDNVERHKLPDAVGRVWSLDRRIKRAAASDSIIPTRYCSNPECLAAYERIYKQCPFCGMQVVPSQRSAPEHVDGDLTELSPEVLAKMRGDVEHIEGAPRIPINLSPIVQKAIVNRHYERKMAHVILRDKIALWAGYHRDLGQPDSEIYRRFYFTFGTDIMTAQAYGINDAIKLTDRLNDNLAIMGVVEKCE